MVQPLWKTFWQFLKQLKTQLPDDLVIPLLGIYLREVKTCSANTCTRILAAALFIIAKECLKPKCPFMNEWLKKGYFHTMEYLFSRKELIKLLVFKRKIPENILCLVKEVSC